MSVELNGTYDIRYDDGDEELTLRPIRFGGRPAPRLSTKLREAAFRRESATTGTGKSTTKARFLGTAWIGTYDINYDDDEKELRVEERISQEAVGRLDIAAAVVGKFPQEGDKVEARGMSRRRSTTPARFQEIRGDGTYDTASTTGKSETRVGPS